ncbi:hypothetical protein F4861DRAFT_499785 [Xylaria intraflava]|nr:hypothetical protein F4861DRAFT_499785 [Xylaria intraflava]
MANKRKSFYGVREGRIRGVYDTWEGCKAQVDKCTNEYRGFDTRDEAEFYVATGCTLNSDASKTLFAEWTRTRRNRSLAENGSQREKQAENKPRIKNEAFSASQSFFSQVPNFEPDDKADFDEEFGRFASSQNIAPGSHAWRQKRADAVRHEMIFHYSQAVDSDDEDDIKREDEDDTSLPPESQKLKTNLRVYQNMCREVDLEPLDTAAGCITNLNSVLVNIIDYIDAKRNNKPIKVWAPEEFEAFKRYTLAPGKRVSSKDTDELLRPLLQFLRPMNASNKYQNRRYLAEVAREDHASRTTNTIANQEEKSKRCLSVIKEESSPRRGTNAPDYEVISIHGSESDFSSSSRTFSGEIVDLSSSPNSSIEASVVKTSSSHKIGVKRELDSWDDGQDISYREGTPTSVYKRRKF